MSGPIVSVPLATSRQDQRADKRIQIEWRILRQQLDRQSADSRTLDVIEAEVEGTPEVLEPQGESLFAVGGNVIGTCTPAAPPPHAKALFPVADAVETALDHDRRLPCIVVAIDRQGDVWATNATGAADKIVATAEAVGAFRIRRRCRQGNRGPA